MSSIKDQKLELYRKYLLQRDRGHFIIRYNGSPNAEESVIKECQRMWDDYHSKITEVPKRYTLAMLKSLQ